MKREQVFKDYHAFVLKERKDRREEQLAAARADLQQRYNEEAAFVRLVELSQQLLAQSHPSAIGFHPFGR